MDKEAFYYGYGWMTNKATMHFVNLIFHNTFIYLK